MVVFSTPEHLRRPHMIRGVSRRLTLAICPPPCPPNASSPHPPGVQGVRTFSFGLPENALQIFLLDPHLGPCVNPTSGEGPPTPSGMVPAGTSPPGL